MLRKWFKTPRSFKLFKAFGRGQIKFTGVERGALSALGIVFGAGIVSVIVILVTFFFSKY